MHYTINELSEAVGIEPGTLRALMQRGQFVPGAIRPGTGREIQFTRPDACQAAIFGAMARAKGKPLHAMHVVSLLADKPDWTCFTVWLCNGGRGVRIVGTGEPLPTETHRLAFDMHAVLLDLKWRLQSIEARRAVTDPADYPHRFALKSPKPEAQWFVILADGVEGEADGECVAAICDAFERQDNIMVASRSREALAAVVKVIDRMSSAEVPAAVH